MGFNCNVNSLHSGTLFPLPTGSHCFMTTCSATIRSYIGAELGDLSQVKFWPSQDPHGHVTGSQLKVTTLQRHVVMISDIFCWLPTKAGNWKLLNELQFSLTTAAQDYQNCCCQAILIPAVIMDQGLPIFSRS